MVKRNAVWRQHQNTFSGLRVLITGHTGFKGGWLSRMLHALGAELYGYALPPNTEPSFYESTNVSALFHREWLADIRDTQTLRQAVEETSPQVVFHLAAQPSVLDSYTDPVETFETNVMGTVHLLELLRPITEPLAVLVVTSDKCYENREWDWGYREADELGGHDPYSTSKACAELVTRAYCRSFFDAHSHIRVATARAGNIIGGGDWSPDRLVPDLIRGLTGDGIKLRSPASIRPWQHVLDALNGYLLVAGKLCHEQGLEYEGAWNFGPEDQDICTVETVARHFAQVLQSDKWSGPDSPPKRHEAKLLKLDSSKSRNRLAWQPRLRLEDAVALTARWYLSHDESPHSIASITDEQITEFFHED